MKSGSGVAAVETPVNRIQAAQEAPRFATVIFSSPERAKIFNAIEDGVAAFSLHSGGQGVFTAYGSFTLPKSGARSPADDPGATIRNGSRESKNGRTD